MRPCLSSLPVPKGLLEGAVTTITAHSDTTPDCSPGLNTLQPPTHPAAPRSTLLSLFYCPENRLERFKCLDSVSCAYTLVYCMSKLMVLKSGMSVPSYFFSHWKTEISENPDFYARFVTFQCSHIIQLKEIGFAWGLAFSPSPCVLRCRSRFTNERWGLVTGESGVEDLVGNTMMLMKWVQSSLSALTYLESVLVCCRLQQASRETLRWILIYQEMERNLRVV